MPEVSSEGTKEGNLEVLLISALLGSLYGLEIGTNVGNELGFSDVKVLGTTLVSMDGLSLGKYDGTVIRSLEVSTEVIEGVNLEVLLIAS